MLSAFASLRSFQLGTVFSIILRFIAGTSDDYKLYFNGESAQSGEAALAHLKSLFSAVLLIGAGLSATPALAATTLYGMDSGGQLITIGTTNAATTSIGAPSGVRVGLAQSSLTGIAYTRSFNTLFSIDLASGITTSIGASGSFLTGLAFNLAGNVLYSIDQSSGAFYSVNTANGTPTLIGQTNQSTMLDLATNSAGVVYGVNLSGDIYTINTTTGAATFVSRPINEGLTSIEFDASDNLYAIGISSDTLYSNVLTVPVSVGVLTPRLSDVRGLLFQGAGVAPVPEPATWAMMILGFGAVGGALRRRQKVTTRISYAI